MTAAPLRAAVIGTARVGSFFDDLLTATPELLPSSQASCYATHPRTQLVAGQMSALSAMRSGASTRSSHRRSSGAPARRSIACWR